MRNTLLFTSTLLLFFLVSVSTMAQVSEEWVARYNSPENAAEAAIDVAVDEDGNVYITGASRGVGTFDDYATIKYSAAGVQLWVARYNGPGNFFDRPADLAIDNEGNVYVTGTSAGIGTDDDYATIKYNSAGVLQWVTRYNGSGNSVDAAHSLAVDENGNVYVTGQSTGDGTGTDYATMKLNSAGAIQWITRYNGPGNSSDGAGDLVIDNDFVYVTGSSTGDGTKLDYATIKHNITTGEIIWVSRYNGAGNDRDVTSSLTVDNAGNVYVTGTIISGFDPSGDPFPFEFFDWATIKYNNVGAQQWVSIHDEGGDDFAESVLLDNLGNVIVTGSISNSPPRVEEPDQDYGAIKYNASTGAEIWVAKYGPPPGDTFDNEWRPTDQAIDTEGNIYVTGQTGQQEYGTIKWNNDGVLQWAVTYKEGVNQVAYAIEVDAAGNVYVTGGSSAAGLFETDFATIKYNQVQIACGKKGDKILVCHKGKHTLCINRSDTAAHLAHGDQLGACTTTITGTSNARESEPVAGIQNLPARLQVSVIPNPAITSARILYELPAGGRVSIQLFDMFGREVRTVEDASKPAGFHNAEFNVSALPHGMYYYRITVRSAKTVWSQTGKIMH